MSDAPVIHAHLEQGSPGDSDAGFYSAAFQMAWRESGAGRCTPKVPDAVRALADAQYHGAAVFCVGERHGIVIVGAEPWVAAVEASANVGAIVA